jgi:hypothetical protein
MTNSKRSEDINFNNIINNLFKSSNAKKNNDVYAKKDK